jgi:GNAT superfamily N-acetyltransferase
VGYTTKELDPNTWADFETLFSRGNGWDFCWCMAFQRGGGSHGKLPRAERSVLNRKEKAALVETGRAHGILVFEGDEPVGWCQFGPADELPLPEYRRRTAAPSASGNAKRWLITCFVTMKEHRSRGVTAIALRAALDAIRPRGGGLVQAFPVGRLSIDADVERLVREKGADSSEVRRRILERTGGSEVTVYDGWPCYVKDVSIDGVGPVTGVIRRRSNWFFQGTVETFKKQGFKAVSVAGPTQLVMERTVRGARVRRDSPRI